MGVRRSTKPKSVLDQRLPPSDLRAEQALLGALLVNNKAYERVAEFLHPDHFADPIHGRIFWSIARLIGAGQLADAVTLNAELGGDGTLDEVGGTAYLGQLLTATVGIVNAAECGHAIIDAWRRRQLIDIGETVVNTALDADSELDGAAQIEAAEQHLFRLATEVGDRVVPFERALTDAILDAERALRLGGIAGLTTGLRDLDARTGGLHPADLMILAGRPGMGKTALATKIIFSAASALLAQARAAGPAALPKSCITVFSMESPASRLLLRIIASEAGIPASRVRSGDIDQNEFNSFVNLSRNIYNLPIQIDDTPAITLSALRTRCRRLKRAHGLSLVVVDYLQLMRPAAGTRPEHRTMEITQITQGLKSIASELAVPVLALSQLSRKLDSRSDKRPRLADLRESGSIEEDADCVIFIYRDDYYLSREQPKPLDFETEEEFEAQMGKWQHEMQKVHHRAELIIAKQRHGPTGTVCVSFEPEFFRFTDYTEHAS